jgi:hypothetical protein
MSSDSGDANRSRNNSVDEERDRNAASSNGATATIEQVLLELDAYENSKRSPASNLSRAVKTALKKELSVYQNNLEALRKDVRKEAKCIVARDNTTNKINPADLDDPASCEYCLVHGRLCIVKAKGDARPLIVPRPRELRVGKNRDEPEYWLSRSDGVR